MRIVKDPLTHFLAAGLTLFLIGAALHPPESDVEKIVVDRAALLQFIQYRSKAFDAGAAATLLDGLDRAARARLIEEYVREEALAREAAALGLSQGDYVIRQRMVQKAEFIAEAAAVAPEPTEAEVAAHYEANRDSYASEPSATLTHVFVSAEGTSPEKIAEGSRSLLARLKSEQAGFNDATRYGDRFLFHKNYVDRTEEYIRSQLGDAATDAAFDPTTKLNEWFGPYRSQYGEHLIFVSARTPAWLPPLSEIADLVKADLAEERRQQAIDRGIDAMVEKYGVEDRFDAGK